jgi:hypothetical protein
MADSLLNLTIGLLEAPASVSERALFASADYHSSEGRARLVRELAGLIAHDSRVRARVDSVTRGAAEGSVAIDISDGTVGDKLRIHIPGEPVQEISIGATADASAAAGILDASAASDTASGAELVAIVEANRVLSRYLTASNASGTVTLTAKEPGSWADGITMVKEVTTGGVFTLTQFSGGDDVLAKPSMTVTFGAPDIAADDTISIGARVYTWVASASADGQITLSTTPATAATNFADAVNADTNLTGICSATRDGAVVTLTFDGDPRLAQHIGVDYTETNAGSVVLGGETTGGATSETPTLGTTVTGSSTSRSFGAGAA